MHWSLDVTFREDNCRIRDKNAALNISWLRKFALSLLRNEKSFKKASIRRKKLKAWASPAYLSKILEQDWTDLSQTGGGGGGLILFGVAKTNKWLNVNTSKTYSESTQAKPNNRIPQPDPFVSCVSGNLGW